MIVKIINGMLTVEGLTDDTPREAVHRMVDSALGAMSAKGYSLSGPAGVLYQSDKPEDIIELKTMTVPAEKVLCPNVFTRKELTHIRDKAQNESRSKDYNPFAKAMLRDLAQVADALDAMLVRAGNPRD